MLPKPPTFSVWSKEYGEILHRISPGYQLNKEIKGIRTEFLRRHDSGLLVSQNSIRVRTDFRHGFAVLVSRFSKTSGLYSILHVGGRFDHNYDIWHACNRILNEGGKKSPQSRHGHLKGFEAIVEQCVTEAENRLLPSYIETLRRGRPRLVDLFLDAQNVLSTLERSQSPAAIEEEAPDLLPTFAEHFRLESRNKADWHEVLQNYWKALVIAKKAGIDVKAVLAYRWKTINLKADDICEPPRGLLEVPSGIRNTAIVLNNHTDFVGVRAELPQIIERLQKI